MSLEKAIKHGKEKRKKYRKSKAFDKTCRNHGACGHCKGDRTFSRRKAERTAQEKVEEAENATYHIHEDKILDLTYDKGEDDHIEREKIANGLNRYYMETNKKPSIQEELNERPTQEEWDLLVESDCSKANYIDELIGFIQSQGQELWDKWISRDGKEKGCFNCAKRTKLGKDNLLRCEENDEFLLTCIRNNLDQWKKKNKYDFFRLLLCNWLC